MSSDTFIFFNFVPHSVFCPEHADLVTMGTFIKRYLLHIWGIPMLEVRDDII